MLRLAFLSVLGLAWPTGNDLKTSLRLGANTAASAGIAGGIGGFVKGMEIRKTNGFIDKNCAEY